MDNRDDTFMTEEMNVRRKYFKNLYNIVNDKVMIVNVFSLIVVEVILGRRL